MNNTVWINLGRLALLMALQLLVFSHVSLGGYVMPMVYVLFLLMLPTGMRRTTLLLIAFATGLLVDMMSNALGFHALACTVVAMLRIWFGDRVLTRGEPVVVVKPSVYSVTPQYFISYLLLMYGAFYVVLFGAELLSARGLGDMLLAVAASTLVSVLLSVLYQWIFIKREKAR